jgi:hypothetical protein
MSIKGSLDNYIFKSKAVAESPDWADSDLLEKCSLTVTEYAKTAVPTSIVSFSLGVSHAPHERERREET